MDSVLLFCDVDDFCKAFEPQWRQGQTGTGRRRRRRGSRLATSEIMTIVIVSMPATSARLACLSTGFRAELRFLLVPEQAYNDA